MARMITTSVVAAVALAGCAGQQHTVRPAQPAPWGALVSPSKAMEIVFSDVCLTALEQARGVEGLALDHWLRPVPPRSTGSSQATAAWRLASYSEVYVVTLPNGGCSASVEAGDPQALHDAALSLMSRHVVFSKGLSMPEQDNVRTAWCTAEQDKPLVVALVRRTGGRRPAFVANVFRAQGARPSFCTPET